MALDVIALGHRIRGARKKRGISQMELARQIYVSPTYVSYIESGTKSVSIDTFVLIANALNVSADELLFDSLDNTVKVSNHRFATIVADCSEYEIKVFLELLTAAKKAMREYRHLL